MSNVLNVVAISGSTSRPSRSLALTQAILNEFSQHLPIKSHVIDFADAARGVASSLYRTELSPELETELQRIENADLLIVTVPVYRATYPGLFKHLFDLVGQNALINKPVLLAANGGNHRHGLILDHQLRPLFGFFQAFTLPSGIYATEADFANYQVTNPELLERIENVVQRSVQVLAPSRYREAVAV